LETVLFLLSVSSLYLIWCLVIREGNRQHYQRGILLWKGLYYVQRI